MQTNICTIIITTKDGFYIACMSPKDKGGWGLIPLAQLGEAMSNGVGIVALEREYTESFIQSIVKTEGWKKGDYVATLVPVPVPDMIEGKDKKGFQPTIKIIKE